MALTQPGPAPRQCNHWCYSYPNSYHLMQLLILLSVMHLSRAYNSSSSSKKVLLDDSLSPRSKQLCQQQKASPNASATSSPMTPASNPRQPSLLQSPQDSDLPNMDQSYHFTTFTTHLINLALKLSSHLFYFFLTHTTYSTKNTKNSSWQEQRLAKFKSQDTMVRDWWIWLIFFFFFDL